MPDSSHCNVVGVRKTAGNKTKIFCRIEKGIHLGDRESFFFGPGVGLFKVISTSSNVVAKSILPSVLDLVGLFSGSTPLSLYSLPLVFLRVKTLLL